MILGSDGVGVREDGERVVANPGIDWGNNDAFQEKQFHIKGMPENGFLAEKCDLLKSQIYPAPHFLTDQECAALPLVGLTAYRSLFNKGCLKSGQKVLITGAGGGVASIAIQMAVAAGSKVYCTTSSEYKLERAKAIGAVDGVLYTEKGWWQRLKECSKGLDLIIDGAGGDDFDKLLDLCNPGGKIIVYGGTQGAYPPINPAKVFWKQISIIGTTMGSNFDFQKMLVYISHHTIRPVIDKEFALENINEALEYLGNYDQFGKIIIKIKED